MGLQKGKSVHRQDGGGGKKKREMEGLVMRKVREGLCLIVWGGGGGVGREGAEAVICGVIIIAGNLSVCVCLSERRRDEEI